MKFCKTRFFLINILIGAGTNRIISRITNCIEVTILHIQINFYPNSKPNVGISSNYKIQIIISYNSNLLKLKEFAKCEHCLTRFKFKLKTPELLSPSQILNFAAELEISL